MYGGIYVDDGKWKKMCAPIHTHSVKYIKSENGAKMGTVFECADGICLFCEGAEHSRELEELLLIYMCDSARSGKMTYGEANIRWQHVKETAVDNWNNGLDAWGNPDPCHIKPAKK